MSGNVLEKFERAKADILSGDTRCFHYPLLEIMRDVTGMRASQDNLPSLSRHNIDPEEFKALWDLGFAKETLGNGDGPAAKPVFEWHAKIQKTRCEKSLQNNSLPPEIQERLRQTLDLLQNGLFHTL